MSTYYMRADGTAANKAAAVGPETDAAACMPVAVHNDAETFSAGDTITVSGLGGTFTSSLVPPSSGTSENPITYQGTNGATITPASGTGISITSKNYITVNDITLGVPVTRNFVSATSTGTVANRITATGGSYECFYINGGTATLTDCTAITPGLYGFNMLGAATTTLTRCNSYGGNGGFYCQGTSTTTGYSCKAYDTTSSKSGFVGMVSSVSTWYNCETYNTDLDGFTISNNATMNCWYCSSHHNLASGDGYTAHGDAGGSTMNLYYCIAYKNDKSGAAMTTLSSGVIYNCSFYDNYYSGDAAKSFGIWLNATGTWVVKNNITMNHVSEMYVSATAVAGITLTSDYNMFNDSRGGTAFHWDGTDYNFTDYKTASSQDANSINDDPLFEDAANDNFRLAAESPAIDAGTNLSLTLDYDGYTLPYSSAFDMGAFEHHDTFVYGKGRLKSGTGLTTVTSP